MPPTIYVNRNISEGELRESIYAGNFHLFTGRKESLEIVHWVRTLLAEAFDNLDPQLAQYSLPVPEFVRRVGPLKSRFTNDPRTRDLCRELLIALGCDPAQTYFDLPRLRVAPASGYLTSGVSYAYKAHRDTWYSHPPTLVNFWTPVFDATGREVMSFWPGYFGQPVRNTGFDYEDWVKHYRNAAINQIGEENRPHPLPTEAIDERREIRIALNAGDMTLFSTCHLHATADNTSGRTRFSYDLRMVNIADLRAGRGPADVDGTARGSTLPDFIRVSDFEPLRPELLPQRHEPA